MCVCVNVTCSPSHYVMLCFQVEKAFREGTARQNAHSIFVCLALKLLEERVHVACKEIITLEKQVLIFLVFKSRILAIKDFLRIFFSQIYVFPYRRNFLKKKRRKNVKKKNAKRGEEQKKERKSSEERKD